MIPFAGLGAKIAGSMVMGRVKNEVAQVPKWLWYVLIVVLAYAAFQIWHGGKVKAYGRERYEAGVRDAAAEFNAKARKITEQAVKLKQDADALKEKINARQGAIFVNDVRDVNELARALSMRGPRATQCPGGAAGNSHLPGVPRGANSQGSAARGNAKVAGPGVWVDWIDLVDRAKLCDIDQKALRRWEGWHYEHSEADRIWRDKAGAAH